MSNASALDDPAFLTEHDMSRMLEVVEASPAHWRDGFARAASVPLDAVDVDAICVCGMGGSGISGDVLAAVAATRSPVPVVVVKGFDLPAWVGERTLVIPASYSGGTEETIACAEAALHRKAQMVVVARGGRLGEIADDAGVPCLIPEPGGLMPRAALPGLASAVLTIGAHAGAVPDIDALVAEMDDVLTDTMAVCGPVVPLSRNHAKGLASIISSAGTATIWGQEGTLGVAAMRFKGQLNENAKLPAAWGVVPEALHNEICAPAFPLLLLRPATERAEIERRMNALSWPADDGDPTSPAYIVDVLGDGDLALFASAALFADLVSLYCAALRGVDPSPIEAIARLKRALD